MAVENIGRTLLITGFAIVIFGFGLLFRRIADIKSKEEFKLFKKKNGTVKNKPPTSTKT